jgi:hypothetical protein
MQRTIAFLLVFFFCLQTAVAGVSSQQAKFYGGTTSAPPVNAVGFLDTKNEEKLSFVYKAGKNSEIGKYPGGSFGLPYARATKLTYSQAKHLRVGQTIALAAVAGAGGLLLLLSKSHSHYLTINYKDEKDHDQIIDFEIGKDAIKPLLSALELRTGKKVEYETGVTSPAQNKP